MSYADTLFINMCQDIIENGISDKNESVRPIWTDGKEAHTLKKFCVANRYDLSKEFPILTIRKIPLSLCVDEMLWIWQKKSNKIKDLKSSVWDEWTDKDGTIGKAYGFQMSKLSLYKDINTNSLVKAFGESELIPLSSDSVEQELLLPKTYKNLPITYDYMYYNKGYKAFHVKGFENVWALDQTDITIYLLKVNPFSRRIVTNLFNHDDLIEMNLYPCAYSMTFNVTKDKDGNKVLNGILNQRSQDILAANGWNVSQYAVLLHLLALTCDMKAGEFVHVIADAHIYDRHISTVKELIKMDTHEAPKLIINKKDSFYDYTTNDIKLENYIYSSEVKNIEIAV